MCIQLIIYKAITNNIDLFTVYWNNNINFKCRFYYTTNYTNINISNIMRAQYIYV